MKGSAVLLAWRQLQKPAYGYAAAIAAYILLLAWLYPSVATNPAVTRLMHSLPPALLKLAGISSNFSTYTGYMASEFYSVIDIWVLMWFVVMQATQLMGAPRQNHSLQWWLSTPTSRTEWVLGQALALGAALLLLTGVATGAGILGAWWWNGGHLHWAAFLWLNFIALMVSALIAAYSLMLLTVVQTPGWPLSITLVLYGMNLIGGLSAKLAFLSNLSVFGIYQPGQIVAGATPTLFAMVGFLVAIGLFVTLACILFNRQDLAL